MKKIPAIIYSEWRRLKISLIIASVVSVLSLIIVPFFHAEKEFTAICVGFGMGLTIIWVILMFESIGTDHEQAAFSSGMPVRPGLVFAIRIILRTLIAGTVCLIILSMPIVRDETSAFLLRNFLPGILIYLAGILTVSSVGSKSRFLFGVLVAFPFIIFQIPSWGAFACISEDQFWVLSGSYYFILMAAMSCHLCIRRAHGKRITPAIILWIIIMIVLPWMEYIAARTYWNKKYDRTLALAGEADIRIFSEKTIGMFGKKKYNVFPPKGTFRRFWWNLTLKQYEPYFDEKLEMIIEEYNMRPGDAAFRNYWREDSHLITLILLNHPASDEEYLGQVAKSMMFLEFSDIFPRIQKNFRPTPERCRLLAGFLKNYRDIKAPNKYNISVMELADSYPSTKSARALPENIYAFFTVPIYIKTKTDNLNFLIDNRNLWKNRREKIPGQDYFARYSVKLDLYITYFELLARVLESGSKEFPDKLPPGLARENLEYLKTARYIVLKDTHYDYSIQIDYPQEKK